MSFFSFNAIEHELCSRKIRYAKNVKKLTDENTRCEVQGVVHSK